MGYRGYGSFMGDFVEGMDTSTLEDVGLDLSSYPDVSPDEFADVVSGTSTVESPPFLGGGVTGSSIMKFLGGGGALSQLSSFLGSGAAAGAASLAVPSAKAVARLMGRRLKQRGGRLVVAGGGRRMNPGNFKALRRSMRRLSAFEHAAKRVLHFTHPARHAPVKFKFKRRRRKH